ncbi:hypothetical protein A1O1_06874 [Capronia coronata CBS 617.96]|uniref:FAD dependent oxidoreductase domain-containing protein n=1 Tax=Capronia coronata CBS 617.96 TaxID=1182541 RepID=W9Y0T5_9EURO|nr:uncharacterized protein A1O1_06874 [Capronia coronata CBS 617.96]EXJ83255.1 hypothetical protein A1O1_06874 [Capronia coronata CBS 617.96]
MAPITEAYLTTLATADPGLPVPRPTTPHWLKDPHALAQVQSASLPKAVDVVVIGSGITALSIARTLLSQSPSIRVTILEARALCSGATGRNGGQIVTYGAAAYSQAKRVLGAEAATKFVDFTFDNVAAMSEAVKEYAMTESEYRQVRRIRCFTDPEYFKKACESIAEYERDNPKSKHINTYTVVDAQQLLKDHGIHGVAGGIIYPAAAFWPYRFIAKTYQTLLNQYPSRFSIETETSVTRVLHDSQGENVYPYAVETSRGLLRATHVVHATNGHAGHLLPALRGRIVPYCGTMTVQDYGTAVPNRGDQNTWSVHQKPQLDESTGALASGTYYVQQNAVTGQFWFGGEFKTLEETLSADDSSKSEGSVEHLKQRLAQFFGLKPRPDTCLVSAWSGVMGFTCDGFPLVARLPKSLTSRDGTGEWIAAGFNGMGMSMCLLAGKGLALKILGFDVSDWFPESAFGLSSDRLQSRLTVRATVDDFLSDYQSAIKATKSTKDAQVAEAGGITQAKL